MERKEIQKQDYLKRDNYISPDLGLFPYMFDYDDITYDFSYATRMHDAEVNNFYNSKTINSSNFVIFTDFPLPNTSLETCVASLAQSKDGVGFINSLLDYCLNQPEAFYSNASTTVKEVIYLLWLLGFDEAIQVYYKIMNITLNRFIHAQNGSVYNKTEKYPTYEEALQEIKNGSKHSHWIWYILPQMKGLGHSELSNFYGIQDRAEAETYMQHPVLGPRLIETVKAIYDSPVNVYTIFGNDTIKVYSCVKLFSTVSDNEVFKLMLVKNNWH